MLLKNRFQWRSSGSTSNQATTSRTRHRVALRLLMTLVLTLLAFGVTAQSRLIKGRVVDDNTGQGIPFVQVGIMGTRYGTTTDADGRYELRTDGREANVTYQMMGYETEMHMVQANKSATLNVHMRPQQRVLKEVTVKSKKRRRERYRRRDNPAVELILRAADSRGDNRLDNLTPWQHSSYWKSVISTEHFTPKFDRWINRPIRFLEPYMDRYDPLSPHIHLLMAEGLARERSEEDTTDRQTFALKLYGLGEKMVKMDGDEVMDELMPLPNIYESDIELFEEHFPSPISKLGVAVYRYYIIDTTLVEGDSCIRVAFTPEVKESYAFVGEVLLTADSACAVKQVALKMHPHVAMNFVKDFSFQQLFHRDSMGHQLPSEASLDATIYLYKWLPQIHLHQDYIWGSYDFGSLVKDSATSDTVAVDYDTVVPVAPDSATSDIDIHDSAAVGETPMSVGIPIEEQLSMEPVGDRSSFVQFRPRQVVIDLPEPTLMPSDNGRVRFDDNGHWTLAIGSGKDSLKLSDTLWTLVRPIPMVGKELMMDSMVDYMRHIPIIRFLNKWGSSLVTGYYPTALDKDSSYFDIGSVWSIYSLNQVEGSRWRLGGMTTSRLSAENALSCYVAYGTEDKRAKGGISYVHSFNDKKKHPREFPERTISLDASYDLEQRGVSTGNMSRDNILLSGMGGRAMEYVSKADIKFHHDWKNHLSLSGGLDATKSTPAVGFCYNRITEDGGLEPVLGYYDTKATLRLSYSPTELRTSSRRDMSNLTKMGKNRLMLSLTQTSGLLSGGFQYNTTELSANGRVWIPLMGRIDCNLLAGAEWNRAPLAKLYYPPSSNLIFLTGTNFRMMEPLEFVTDRYVTLFAKWDLRGAITNRIPVVRRWYWKEVLTFSMLWGSLSDKNNPNLPGNVGLYQLPEGCGTLDPRVPYMEASVGIANIFKMYRIDYVWRLTYKEGLEPKQKGGLRLSMYFSF